MESNILHMSGGVVEYSRSPTKMTPSAPETAHALCCPTPDRRQHRVVSSEAGGSGGICKRDRSCPTLSPSILRH